MASTRTNKERLYDIIKKPLISEKSMMAVQMGQYTFEVDKDASKVEIKSMKLQNGISGKIENSVVTGTVLFGSSSI